MSRPRLIPGDTVAIDCASDTWYKNVPGLLLSHEPFITRVMVAGKVLDVCPSSLKVLTRAENAK